MQIKRFENSKRLRKNLGTIICLKIVKLFESLENAENVGCNIY